MTDDFDLRSIASKAVLRLWEQVDDGEACGCHLCHVDVVLNLITEHKESM